MGIYTFSDSYTSEVLAVDEYANFEDLSLQMVAESEANYSNIMKAIGLDELRYFEETGTEMIYEASGASGVIQKIKMFFQKLIEKVRKIIHTFIAKMRSWIQGDKDFVTKYQKEFSKKWSSVKNDFEFKGYNFTIKSDFVTFDEDATKKITDDSTDDIGGKSLSALCADETALRAVTTEVLKTALDKIRSNADEIDEEIRAGVANTVSASTSDKTLTESSLDAAEFSTVLFECYRNGESTKEHIEKSKLSVHEIIAGVSGKDKAIRNAENLGKAVQRTFKAVIKDLENFEKALIKAQPGADKTESDLTSAMLGVVSVFTDITKKTANYFTQAQGICVQALADRARQYKAIMVKVIGGGKKMQEESAKYYGYEGSDSFLESVVLK